MTVNFACVAVKESVKLIPDSNETWGTGFDDANHSFVSCAQEYSLKSKTSLSSSAVIFYSFLLTFLNFSEKRRQKHVEQSVTVLARLLLSFGRMPNRFKFFKQETKVS